MILDQAFEAKNALRKAMGGRWVKLFSSCLVVLVVYFFFIREISARGWFISSGSFLNKKRLLFLFWSI